MTIPVHCVTCGEIVGEEKFALADDAAYYPRGGVCDHFQQKETQKMCFGLIEEVTIYYLAHKRDKNGDVVEGDYRYISAPSVADYYVGPPKKWLLMFTMIYPSIDCVYIRDHGWVFRDGLSLSGSGLSYFSPSME